jgi:phosphotransferase system HPr-like phosphotransfer protein
MQGSELVLRAQGPDAAQAIEAISQMFCQQFEEMPSGPPT